MKRYIIFAISIAFSLFVYSQKEIDYVEYGIDTNKANTRVLTVLMPEGDTAYVEINKRRFTPEYYHSKYSLPVTAHSIEKLSEKLTYYKEQGYFVKEMYEQNDVYYVLLMKKDE